jgi:hypothetical protein
MRKNESYSYVQILKPLGILIKKNIGVVVIPPDVDIQGGTGRHWWALEGTGGHWWTLVGTGGRWWAPVSTGVLYLMNSLMRACRN